VHHDGAGVVDDAASGDGGADPQAQLGLLAAERHAPDPAEPVVEAADGVEHAAPEGHVRADDVPHLGGRGREPPVAAADHPVELGRKPGGPARVPARDDRAARGDDIRRGEMAGEPLEPARGRDAVVVEERDDRAARRRDARVAGGRQPGRAGVGDDPGAGDLVPDAHLERRRVVDHDDQLDRAVADRLAADARDRRDEVVPALLGVRADDDGDRGRIHDRATASATGPTLPRSQRAWVA